MSRIHRVMGTDQENEIENLSVFPRRSRRRRVHQRVELRPLSSFLPSVKTGMENVGHTDIHSALILTCGRWNQVGRVENLNLNLATPLEPQGLVKMGVSHDYGLFVRLARICIVHRILEHQLKRSLAL